MPCSWKRIFNIFKMSSVLQITCRSCTLFSENTKRCFVEFYKLFLYFIWKREGPRIAKRLPKNVNKVYVGEMGNGPSIYQDLL